MSSPHQRQNSREMGDQQGEDYPSATFDGTKGSPAPVSLAGDFEATVPRSPSLQESTRSATYSDRLQKELESDDSVEYDTDSDSENERPPGAPFPLPLIVAHRWDIGVKFYEHLKHLLDWIDKRLEDDPDGTGEEFMLSGGSSMKFASIWQDFFLLMVESESNGIIERLQYGLKVKKNADRIHQCLHFEYGQGAAGVFAAINLVANFCRRHKCPLTPMARHQLMGLQELLSLPNFPTSTIIVPMLAESHKYGILDHLDPKKKAVRPYLPLRGNKKPEDVEKTIRENEDGMNEYIDWKRRNCKGVRTEEDLPWAPAQNQLGSAVWNWGIGSIASKSMVAEFEKIDPNDTTPYVFEVTGVPLPMEWDYIPSPGTDTRDAQAPPKLPVLQHYIDKSELPDVLLVYDPDNLTLPTSLQPESANKNSDAQTDSGDSSSNDDNEADQGDKSNQGPTRPSADSPASDVNDVPNAESAVQDGGVINTVVSDSTAEDLRPEPKANILADNSLPAVADASSIDDKSPPINPDVDVSKLKTSSSTTLQHNDQPPGDLDAIMTDAPLDLAHDPEEEEENNPSSSGDVKPAADEKASDMLVSTSLANFMVAVELDAHEGGTDADASQPAEKSPLNDADIGDKHEPTAAATTPLMSVEIKQKKTSKASMKAECDQPNAPLPPPIRFKRINPIGIGRPFVETPPPSAPKAPAYLSLSKEKSMGTGNSARVWDAVIEFNGHENLDPSLNVAASVNNGLSSQRAVHESLGGAPIPEKLSVAAKIPYADAEHRGKRFVRNEARIYSLLPPGLSRTYNGYTMAPRARRWQARATVAVYPKFYGYYVADHDDGKNRVRKPILLMEKCGSPVVISENERRRGLASAPPSLDTFGEDEWSFKMTEEHKELVFSMLQRLHFAEFTQHSFSPRNILYQPGPLVLPPSQRSLRTPSFRIIDFGRGVCHYTDKVDSSNFLSPEQQEQRDARTLFGMEEF